MQVSLKERENTLATIEEAEFVRLLLVGNEFVASEQHISVLELRQLIHSGLIAEENVSFEDDGFGLFHGVAVVDAYEYDSLLDERWGYSR